MLLLYAGPTPHKKNGLPCLFYAATFHLLLTVFQKKGREVSEVDTEKKRKRRVFQERSVEQLLLLEEGISLKYWGILLSISNNNKPEISSSIKTKRNPGRRREWPSTYEKCNPVTSTR